MVMTHTPPDGLSADKGTAEQAIEFARTLYGTLDVGDFIQDWDDGDLSCWPEFKDWLAARAEGRPVADAGKLADILGRILKEFANGYSHATTRAEARAILACACASPICHTEERCHFGCGAYPSEARLGDAVAFVDAHTDQEALSRGRVIASFDTTEGGGA